MAELQRKGALVLDTEALKKLIVGRTIHVRNAVSGEEYEILNGPDGRRLITAVNGQMSAADGMDSVFHGRQMQYQLKDGRYEVEIAGTPIELTVYRLGDKYYAARSNEFGYANYELQRVEQADDRPSG